MPAKYLQFSLFSNNSPTVKAGYGGSNVESFDSEHGVLGAVRPILDLQGKESG
ncbi:MAG: hypothetical protein Q6364_03695 [Candidatus Hermodarchaeota archaeon]|nr:hypothetical protein [Candidatus Hermodarchaeota archaeon]